MANKLIYTNYDFGGVGTVTGLKEPVADSDAVRKEDLDDLRLEVAGDIESVLSGLAWKDNVVAASTANVNIASAPATIDGVTLTADARVLLKDQDTAAQNGIYVFSTVGAALVRADDANDNDSLVNAIVPVDAGGTTNSTTTWRQTAAAPITLGTTALSFSPFGGAVAQATESTSGIVELATTAETSTGTDNTRAVTPAGLAGSVYAAKRFSALIGDGVATSFVVEHNLGSERVTVSAYNTAGAEIEVAVTGRDANSVTIGSNFAFASNSVRVLVNVEG